MRHICEKWKLKSHSSYPNRKSRKFGGGVNPMSNQLFKDRYKEGIRTLLI